MLIISACTGKEAPPAAGEGASADNITPAGEFPIAKEKVTLKVMVASNPQVEDFTTNEFTKYLEEKTNIHIEWEVVPEKSAAEKLNLVLAGGDLPDVIMMGVSSAQQMIFGSQGVFLPLNDLIDKYGKETKRMFEEMPVVRETITAPDGNIYAMPSPNECYHCSLANKLWIYKPWLDKLGLDIPTTTDEFYEVLKAFKNEDPNGNGNADEVPFSGSPNAWYAQVDAFLMNSFIYNPGGDRLYLVDGKVDVPYNKPEWREGLQYLHMLYNEGLLDPQALTQDSNQLKQLGENPDIPILGATSGGHMGVMTEFYGSSGRWLEYVTVPPLKGPDGVQQATFRPYQVGAGNFVITKATKHPEAAFRLADALYDEEMTLRTTLGRPGVEWDWAEKGELGINGKPAIWKMISDYGQVQNVHWNQTGPSFRTSDFRLGEVANPDKPLEDMLYKETKQNYEPYKVDMERVLPPLFFNNEQASELADLAKTINDHVEEMMARFITGDASLEKDWDGYVKNLENMNLPRFLEINQEAYDAKYNK